MWGEYPIEETTYSGCTDSMGVSEIQFVGVSGAASLTRGQVSLPAHILVVDDDCEILRLMSRVLTRSGHDVVAVKDGAAAWDALQRNRHDLMVTDNNMPKVSGVELIKKLHDAHMEQMPVILASGTLLDLELRRQPWFKLAATLLKPYTMAELPSPSNSVVNSPSSVLCFAK